MNLKAQLLKQSFECGLVKDFCVFKYEMTNFLPFIIKIFSLRIRYSYFFVIETRFNENIVLNLRS